MKIIKNVNNYLKANKDVRSCSSGVNSGTTARFDI